MKLPVSLWLPKSRGKCELLQDPGLGWDVGGHEKAVGPGGSPLREKQCALVLDTRL